MDHIQFNRSLSDSSNMTDPCWSPDLISPTSDDGYLLDYTITGQWPSSSEQSLFNWPLDSIDAIMPVQGVESSTERTTRPIQPRPSISTVASGGETSCFLSDRKLGERKSKRREQNRQAQRAYRTRKEELLHTLRGEVDEWRAKHRDLGNVVSTQKESIDQLQSHITHLENQINLLLCATTPPATSTPESMGIITWADSGSIFPAPDTHVTE